MRKIQSRVFCGFFYCITVEICVFKGFRDWRNNKGKKFNTEKCLQAVDLTKVPCAGTALQAFVPFITNCWDFVFWSHKHWPLVMSFQLTRDACDNPAPQPSTTCRTDSPTCGWGGIQWSSPSSLEILQLWSPLSISRMCRRWPSRSSPKISWLLIRINSDKLITLSPCPCLERGHVGVPIAAPADVLPKFLPDYSQQDSPFLSSL